MLQTNFANIKLAAKVLRSLNHKLRQDILVLIDLNNKINVTDIYVKMRLDQPVVSQHLAILRTAGIVTTERDGKVIYYSVNYKKLEEVNFLSKKLIDK